MVDTLVVIKVAVHIESEPLLYILVGIILNLRGLFCCYFTGVSWRNRKG